MKKKFLAFVVLMLGIINYPLSACSCVGSISAKDAVKQSDAVFEGIVISIEAIVIKEDSSFVEFFPSLKPNQIVKYKVFFKVERRFKKSNRSEIEIFTDESQGGGCGYPFQVGSKYLVYAKKQSRFFDNDRKRKAFLYTNSCTRTTNKVENERKQILLPKN